MHPVLKGEARMPLAPMLLQHPDGKNHHDENEQVEKNEDGEADANHGGVALGRSGSRLRQRRRQVVGEGRPIGIEIERREDPLGGRLRRVAWSGWGPPLRPTPPRDALHRIRESADRAAPAREAWRWSADTKPAAERSRPGGRGTRRAGWPPRARPDVPAWTREVRRVQRRQAFRGRRTGGRERPR